MARVRIGDIIEIPTRIGLFYAQYTHDDPDYGELIQVTKNSFGKRPRNLEEILDKRIGIIIFFPLNAAVHRKIFDVIGNLPIPSHRSRFPVFRCPGGTDKEGNVKQWKFWDGRHLWPEIWLTQLTDKQKKLPIEGVWNDTLLIERLEEGWTPDKVPQRV